MNIKQTKRFNNIRFKCYSAIKQYAFTLAETLIVMGIIGVVAALTLPNLNSSTGDKEKVTKLKKVYQNLQDAYGRSVAIYGPMDEWTTNISATSEDVKKAGDRITEFMKLQKNNATNGIGLVTGGGSNYYYQFILADNTSVAIYYSHSSGYIIIDIDGENKGQNKYGVDRFQFTYDNNGNIYPFGYNYDDTQLQNNCFKTKGAGCTAWIIQTDNMDYLKATNGTCPNGTILSWTNTSCK